MDNIFSKFSGNLKQALLISEKISAEQNSKIGTEHQLLALIVQKGTLANDILSMFEVTMERAQLVASLVGNKNIPNNGVNQEAKETIKLAVQYAMKYKHSTVDCEHLLLALISNTNFISYNIIERMGVNPKDIKKQINSIFNEASRSISPEFIALNQDLNPETNDIPEPFEVMDTLPGMPQATVKAKKEKSAIKEFSINISEMAKNGKIDPVVGREKEIERIIQILIRRKKNNPVLIGEPGVGKTAIIEGLALKILNGEVPSVIADKELFSLDLSALLAGTMYRGQFEVRIKKLLEEIEKKSNAILFIDELHTVIGAGSAEGSLDAANILKPKLARGEIRVIGATTLDEYKKHIEKDSAFERRFQPIIVSEPTVTETIEILKGLAKDYEKHHNVIYEPDSLIAASQLAARYIQDRFLPDKAIDLIDEAAAARKIMLNSSEKSSILYRDLKNTIEKKDEAVLSEDYEKASFLRQKELSIKNSIAKEEKIVNHKNKIIISSEDIAKIVSKWTGIPTSSLDLHEKNRYLNLEKQISKSIIGQDEAVKEISSSIRRARVGVSNPNRPMGSFIFLGPTGVGKTELVKVLAREVYGSEKSLIKIDMSEFMEKHNVSRLVGAPAGYIGYEEGGQLTERVRRQPYSIILFDEIEKAHPDVFNMLLQIMEDGELTDAKGRRVDFRNTLIIMTSNSGTDLFNSTASIGFNGNKKSKDNTVYEKMVERVNETIEKQFRPEFINRIDKIIIFKPLDEKSIIKISQLELNKLAKRMQSHKITLSFSDQVIKWVAKAGYKPEYGARPMRRIVTDKIENILSEELLAEKFTSGDNIIIDLREKNILFTALKNTKSVNGKNKK